MEKKKSYTAEGLQRCLKAVRNGMSKSAASKAYGVPRSTIVDKIHGRRPENYSKRGPAPALGYENEKRLHEWILSCCRRGFPIRVSDLKYTVVSIILSLPLETRRSLPFKNGVPQDSWYYKFLDRHPTISLRKAEYLSSSRAKVTEGRIRGWFHTVHSLLEEEGAAEILADPSRLFNCDETALWLNPSGNRVLTKKEKTPYSVSTNDDKSNVTIVFTARADGELVPPMYLHRGQRLPPNYSSRLPASWRAKTTEKGWMTVEAFIFYIQEVFDRYVCEAGIKKPVILFVDGHVSHLSIDVTDYCERHGIVLVCLLALSTHLLQPLDLAVFKKVKEMWKTVLRRFRFQNQRDIQKWEVLPLLEQALKEHSLKASIVNGFRKAGLHPWNEEAVDYSKCRFSKESNPWLEEDEVQVPNELNENTNPTDGTTSKNFIHLFEENISAEVLAEFRATLQSGQSWCGDIEKKALYDVWYSFHSKSDAYILASTSQNSAASFTCPSPVRLFDDSVLTGATAHVNGYNCSVNCPPSLIYDASGSTALTVNDIPSDGQEYCAYIAGQVPIEVNAEVQAVSCNEVEPENSQQYPIHDCVRNTSSTSEVTPGRRYVDYHDASHESNSDKTRQICTKSYTNNTLRKIIGKGKMRYLHERSLKVETKMEHVCETNDFGRGPAEESKDKQSLKHFSIVILKAMICLPASVCLENDDSQYANVSKSDLITKLDKMTVKYGEIREKLITLLQQTCFLDKAESKVKAKLKLIKIWSPKKVLNETEEEILKDISEHCTKDLLSGGSDTKYKSFPGSERIDVLGLNYR